MQHVKLGGAHGIESLIQKVDRNEVSSTINQDTSVSIFWLILDIKGAIRN